MFRPYAVSFFYFLNIFGLWLGVSEDMEPLDKEGYLCVPNILLQRAEPQPWFGENQTKTFRKAACCLGRVCSPEMPAPC